MDLIISLDDACSRVLETPSRTDVEPLHCGHQPGELGMVSQSEARDCRFLAINVLDGYVRGYPPTYSLMNDYLDTIDRQKRQAA